MIVFPNGVTPLSITRFLLLSLSEDSNLNNVQMNFCENQNDILSDDDVKRKCWKGDATECVIKNSAYAKKRNQIVAYRVLLYS